MVLLHGTISDYASIARGLMTRTDPSLLHHSLVILPIESQIISGQAYSLTIHNGYKFSEAMVHPYNHPFHR
jgi:hypothetical protein